jgi:uncharacterized protein YeaO (DUF488 family)
MHLAPMIRPDHIKLKRAYEPPAPDDGTRILMDRLWPRRIEFDVAPNFYPAAIGVWPSVMPGWAVMAVRGAEPSVERSAADRRATA